jgi:hypothetical protein
MGNYKVGYEKIVSNPFQEIFPLSSFHAKACRSGGLLSYPRISAGLCAGGRAYGLLKERLARWLMTLRGGLLSDLIERFIEFFDTF